MATRARRSPSILLVSNSVAEREEYTRSLRASGYRVVKAATTVLAYQIATTTPPDMVVTDGHGAGSMSGLELARRLRIHARTRSVPIIVLRSVTRRQDAELAIKAEADMILERPVSADVLRDNVVRLLVACGRFSRPSSPQQEPLSFAHTAENRQHSQAVSSFQAGPAVPAARVSGSRGSAGGGAGENAHPAHDRTCPQCRGPLDYRQKSPVLSAAEPNSREPRQRLRYVSGWFCSNPACEYQELARRRE